MRFVHCTLAFSTKIVDQKRLSPSTKLSRSRESCGLDVAFARWSNPRAGMQKQNIFFETNLAGELPTILKRRRTQTGHYNRATTTSEKQRKPKKTTEATNSTINNGGLDWDLNTRRATSLKPTTGHHMMQQQQRTKKRHEDTSSSPAVPSFTDDVPHQVNRCLAGLTTMIHCKQCSRPAIASAYTACRRYPAPD